MLDEETIKHMLRVAKLAKEHQEADKEQYGEVIADLLMVARSRMSLAFGLSGGPEQSQQLLTRLHRQLQSLINALSEIPKG